ncbi:hypothetical protein [Sphingobacterium sp. UGAL515B_05]|uniref:hypothetical protein n=1 Tax=Sphingobacterium sp. UGAL515B_05 TaxID=2986767 RepID=UPI002955195C|nr:hypothetical protein [Sphingobacterium sp. UGAL515B_05]WON94319.1 hypothetical protein OK025_24130 [Sphingobacterium sp. UGAL515B_05]
MTKKYIEATIKRINDLKASQTLKLHNEHYLLKDYDMSIVKIERGFSAEINFKILSGYNSDAMHRIKLPQPIKLTNEEATYYIPENSIHLNQRFKDLFGDDDSTLDIVGSIDRLSTAESASNFDEKFLRFVVPVNKTKGKLREIRGWTYEADVPADHKNLIKVTINKIEYHFFEFTESGDTYLFIDSTSESTLSEFTNICYSILLAFGFLYGNLYLDEGYMLSSTKDQFTEINDISFSIYRESILSTYRIHTTNAYSVHDMTGKDERERDEKHAEVKKWISKIVEIEEPIFSAICELFYNHEPISRAIIITLQANLLPLEIKGSALSLALEAITSVFIKLYKEKIPPPVDKILFKEIKEGMVKVLKETLPDEEQYEDAHEIFKIRIDNLNGLTNMGKLQQSFAVVGYTLKEYEKDALKARNKFQHGELPVTDDSEDVITQQVYFMTIIMHRLIYTLILKHIGYKGYIINYPQLHSDLTNLDLGEDVFYEI